MGNLLSRIQALSYDSQWLDRIVCWTLPCWLRFANDATYGNEILKYYLNIEIKQWFEKRTKSNQSFIWEISSRMKYFEQSNPNCVSATFCMVKKSSDCYRAGPFSDVYHPLSSNATHSPWFLWIGTWAASQFSILILHLQSHFSSTSTTLLDNWIW